MGQQQAAGDRVVQRENLEGLPTLRDLDFIQEVVASGEKRSLRGTRRGSTVGRTPQRRATAKSPVAASAAAVRM